MVKMKVKEGVVEQDDENSEDTQFCIEEETDQTSDVNTEDTQFCTEEETDQTSETTVSQFSLSIHSTIDSFPMTKQRKPLEIKKKFVSIRKRFSVHTQKTMQVVSDDRWETIRHKRKRVMNDHLYDPVKVESAVMKRAEEVQAKLGSKFPIIIRSMLRSNVTIGFWMNFPRRFCNLHLPKHDTSVILVDEKGEEYKTNFLVGKSGLSGGWKAYSNAHNLRERDVLVFQFVRPSKCKVYTLRRDELAEVDGALGLLELAACRMGFERDIKICREAHQKCSDSLWVDITPENIQKNTLNLGSLADESEIISHDLGSNTLESIRCSGSLVDFKEVQGIEDSIPVNGFNIDSELSENYRSKYYKLYCQQNLHLPDRLLENINIADTIKACKLSATHADYALSDKTLEGFEVLGKNVEYLHAHLNRLVSLAYKSKEACEDKRYREATREKTCLEEEITTFELKDATERISKMLNPKVKSHKHGLSLQEELHVQW